MFAFSADRSTNCNLSEIALKSGFKFRDIENRRLDWKNLGCVDVNKVIENQDFEFLEKITPKIIEAPMQSILGTAALDPAVSSLFRLAQMSLQYLSFCQQFMSHTLYDLRIAFNHLQKKYSNLKHNYKCLEEQHYKAQERIQSLLNESKNDIERIVNQIPKPASLFPCDQCTKNFLTAESLKSHQQRKHSAIEEKHELSDDNEKGICKDVIKQNSEQKNSLANKSEQMIPSQKDEQVLPENEAGNSNNNNSENKINANCNTCSKKNGVNLTNIAIQCEVTTIDSELTDKNIKSVSAEKCEQENAMNLLEQQNKLDESGQNAYQTIIELKKEIMDLKCSLEIKKSAESTTDIIASEDLKLIRTQDKIDVIEQKFNAFETMYMESQHQFIESFRNLDEQQKLYMDNIQETIKEIVGKSLGEHDKISIDKEPNEAYESADQNEFNELHGSKMHDTIDAKFETEQSLEKQHSELDRRTFSASSSQTEDGETKVICKVDINTVPHSQLKQKETKCTKKKTKAQIKKITKDMALNEFEQRLRQFGVDADSAGLTTPRSSEVNQDLAEEREEIKKAQKSFDVTRKKLRHEVDRIAKEKLASVSSVTSLSSTTYQSDDEIIETQKIEAIKNRPKSASVQKMRNRNAKKIIRKIVENDIDENDILDKMQMAQKAINAHRECIQELLQTTAHSPSSLTKINNPTLEMDDIKTNGKCDDTNTNQYNKMPHITTRRVVFVNLDEDS